VSVNMGFLSKAPALTEEQHKALRLQEAMAWDDAAAADRLFRFIDWDASGCINFMELKRHAPGFEGFFVLADMDGNGNMEIDICEWQEHFKMNFRANPEAVSAIMDKMEKVVIWEPTKQLADDCFALLDKDKSGAIGSKELASWPGISALSDFDDVWAATDDDGMVTKKEWLKWAKQRSERVPRRAYVTLADMKVHLGGGERLPPPTAKIYRPPPAGPPPPQAPPLPPGWSSSTDPNSGQVYYLNAQTGQSQWHPPA